MCQFFLSFLFSRPVSPSAAPLGSWILILILIRQASGAGQGESDSESDNHCHGSSQGQTCCPRQRSSLARIQTQESPVSSIHTRLTKTERGTERHQKQTHQVVTAKVCNIIADRANIPSSKDADISSRYILFLTNKPTGLAHRRLNKKKKTPAAGATP